MWQIKLRCNIYTLFVFVLFSNFTGKIFTQTASPTELIPIKDLFSKSEKANVQISPDGKMISYLAKYNGVKNVWVKNIGENNDRVVTESLEKVPGGGAQQVSNDIKYYFWHWNSSCIFYLCDKNNDGSHLYLKDLQTKEEINLTPFEGLIVGSILSYPRQNSNEILISTKKRDSKFIDFDVCKVNLETKEISLIEVNSGNILNWIPDVNNKIRAIKGLNKEGKCELLLKGSVGGDFRSIGVLEREDLPVCFSRDGKTFYSIDSRNSDVKKLVAIDVISGSIRTICEDPKYDISYAIFNPNSKKLEAAVIFKYRKNWIFFDDDFESDMKLASKLDYGDISLCSRSGDDSKWIIAYNRDNNPTSFWIFDRKTKKGDFLFFDNEVLSKYEFVKTEPMHFVSKDGLDIEGYITYPKGVCKKNLPLVLHVHGGPWGRNTWCFYPEVQWLANRGYAVLQVNFRGSTGYGKSFLHAGDKQWGKKMQDDLLDAVNWAIKNEIADPHRICIYGFSSGGYSAIMGAALTPEKFCCAVDICGPKNLPDLVNEFASRFHHVKHLFYNRVGNPQTEDDLLKKASPVTYAEQINTPLFIVSGANDFRVKEKDTEKIINSLKKNDIKYEYLLFEDEGHWITKEENVWKLYSSIEKFLAKYLGKNN